MEAVVVPSDRVEQPGGRVEDFAQRRGGGGRGVVAGQDLGKSSVGVGGSEARGGSAVWVAVADDLQVEMVRVPAAGEHRVEQLAGLVPGDQPCMVWR